MDDITTRHNPHEPLDPDENPRVAFEPGDADVVVVSKWAVGLAIGIVVAAFAMWALFNWFEHETAETQQPPLPKAMIEARPKTPPAPNLQAFPKVELRDFKKAEDEWLHSYGWLDKSKGIVNIPIEDAIDAVAKQPPPSKPVTGDPGLDEDGRRLLPEKSSSGRTFEKIAQ